MAPETLQSAKEILATVISTKEILPYWRQRNAYTRISKMLNKNTDQ